MLFTHRRIIRKIYGRCKSSKKKTVYVNMKNSKITESDKMADTTRQKYTNSTENNYFNTPKRDILTCSTKNNKKHGLSNSRN